jgi:threonine aldolase
MFCLSQGLSAPVGSMLAGPRSFIDYARRIRKALGGGMRQAGVLAAPGIIALTEMARRLGEDHARAKTLAGAVAGLPGIKLDPADVETNIIIFGLYHPRVSIPDFIAELGKRRVLALALSGGVRLVTHKDIDDEDVDRAIGAFQEILA